MKSKEWNRQQRKVDRLEKTESKRSIVERLKRLNRRDLGRVAANDPSIMDALSLVRARDLEKSGW